jgi:hypothetical protein
MTGRAVQRRPMSMLWLIAETFDGLAALKLIQTPSAES